MDLMKSEGNQLAPNQMQMMLGNVMPPNIPQMDFNQNLLSCMFHNLKLGRIKKASAHEADIAEYRLRTLNANLGILKAMATFSESVKLEFRKMDHEMKMMEFTEYEKQAIIKNLMLDGQLKEHQVEEAKYSSLTAKLEYELRLRMMEG